MGSDFVVCCFFSFGGGFCFVFPFICLFGFGVFFQTQESIQVCIYKCENMKVNWWETVSFSLAVCSNGGKNLWCLTHFFFLQALTVVSANKDFFICTRSCCKLEEVEEAKDES